MQIKMKKSHDHLIAPARVMQLVEGETYETAGRLTEDLAKELISDGYAVEIKGAGIAPLAPEKGGKNG